MIPISPAAMLLGLAVLGVGVLAALGLLALGLALLLPAWRIRLSQRWMTWSLLALLLVLTATPAVLMSWHLYQQEILDEAAQKARNPRLEEPLLLGDIRFPAGTRVRLERAEPENHWHTGEALPYGLQTLEQAHFETPVRIRGLDVERLEASASSFFSRLRLSSDQRVDSWPCAAGSDVDFRREPVDRLHPGRWQLESCTLQDRALLADVVWPRGSRVYRSQDGWVLQAEGLVEYRGLLVKGLRLSLTEDARLQHWDAELAQAAQLGAMRYDGGTQVWGFANGDLRFTPEPGGARDADGRALPDEHSVFQNADGELLDIRANSEAGIIRWIRLSTP